MSAERDTGMAGGVMSAVDALDLTVDAHVHTGFAAGRDSVGVVVSAADQAGLTALTFADQVGPDTTWLPAYADAVRRARRRTELTLRVAAEVEIVQPDGWLAWPADLSQLEAVSVAVSRLPLADGPVGPRDVRALLAAGELTPEQVAETLIVATVRGVERASRYAPTQLARPLSLLGPGGPGRRRGRPRTCSPPWPPPAARPVRPSRSARRGAVRPPSWSATLHAAGVTLVAASDARYAGEVGRWQYLRRV